MLITVTVNKLMNEIDYENAVVLSIKPKYIKLILSGEKEYEYRKIIPQKNPKHFFIHVSKPISTIKYIFEMDAPVIFLEPIPGNSYGVESFNKGESDYKYAYKIKKIYEIINPVDFKILKAEYGYTAPQNFIYLEKNTKLLDTYKSLELIQLK